MRRWDVRLWDNLAGATFIALLFTGVGFVLCDLTKMIFRLSWNYSWLLWVVFLAFFSWVIITGGLIPVKSKNKG